MGTRILVELTGRGAVNYCETAAFLNLTDELAKSQGTFKLWRFMYRWRYFWISADQVLAASATATAQHRTEQWRDGTQM